MPSLSEPKPYSNRSLEKLFRSPVTQQMIGMHCTCHRVFLATLIVAAKYLNDQSPKNKHWSAHSSVFSVGEVNLMEKQLLSLLDFDLRITESDLASSLQDFMQLQSATTAGTSSSSVATPTASPENATRYASSASKAASVPSPTSSYLPQAAPMNHLSSNKRGSSSRHTMAEEVPYVQQPQEHFKRRPSLPNQPCLEEGEVMPLYKGPIRSNEDQYPSPDAGPDGIAVPADAHVASAYAASHSRWMETGGMPGSAPDPRLSHLPPATSHYYATNQGYPARPDPTDHSQQGRGYGSSRAMC
ncbi:unnamed protein product [Mortierella alpina]